MPKQHAISEQLRHAIQESGYTRYRIAKDLEIDPATLSRFMSGKRGLTLPVIDAIGKLLGLRITMATPRR